ncbi:MAG: rhomboid family intramembrane serine protease, partial [Candidatus Hydrogenedentota bacterium]
GLISLFFTVFSAGAGGISHVGHLGGLITGYLLLLRGEPNSKKLSFWEKIRSAKKKREWAKNQERIFEEMHREEKLDYLLTKISKRGMASLTRKEKKFLKETSQKLQQEKEKREESKSDIH